MSADQQLSSYPKIYALGHRVLRDLFEGVVVVQEKVDGSQFSFGVRDGALHCRSKGAVIDLAEPDSLFRPTVATVTRLFAEGLLREGWTYRGEALQKPKHNTLAYDRVPVGHVILFDVEYQSGGHLPPAELHSEAARLGLESVPLLYHGVIGAPVDLEDLLKLTSVLGGQVVEGVVIKNLERYGPDGKILAGKLVRESFKELHSQQWKADNPSRKDIVALLIAGLATPARFDKAVQHLREAGTLEQSPKDIGALIREVQADVKAECAELIRDKLFDYAWPTIARGIIKGLPEWYKQQLLHLQFAHTTPEEAA